MTIVSNDMRGGHGTLQMRMHDLSFERPNDSGTLSNLYTAMTHKFTEHDDWL